MAASGDRRGPDKAERQLNLVLALTDTKVGFSKAELLQAVHGYRQLWDAADTERARDSLDRMFERDKQDLKKLGVPIEAFEPYDESGNNKATRYCIERSLLEMPEVLSSRRVSWKSFEQRRLCGDKNISQRSLDLDVPSSHRWAQASVLVRLVFIPVCVCATAPRPLS